MSNKDDNTSKKKTTVKPVVPFVAQSRFGGAGNAQFQQKSQYKPTPIRITQHKG